MLNEASILEVISENNGINIQEISQITKIGKHERKKLLIILQKLVKKGVLTFSEKRYHKSTKRLEIGKFDALALMKGYQFGFVKTEDDHIMIYLENSLGAFHNDVVEVCVTGQRKQGKYGVVTRIIERSKNVLVGSVVKVGKNAMLTAIGGHFHRDAQIVNPEKVKSGDKVLCKISFWGDLEDLPRVKVTKILGKSGDIQTEILSVIYSYELPFEFDKKVVKEAQELNDNFNIDSDLEDRKDLRNLHTFTIDPSGSKDFDDAVSVLVNQNGEYEIYVHIADVSHFVKPGSALFSEALSRGNSYYFPKRVIPMLPKIISNNLCSLRPLEEKYAMTVKTTLSKNFDIVDQDLFKSVICSDVRLCYEEVDAVFAGDKTNIAKKDADMLFLADKISKGYFKKRKKYIRFSLPEAVFEFDEEGNPINVFRSFETDSHKMIENFMLIANEYVAKFLSSKNCLYRVHEPPFDNDLIKLKGDLKQAGFDIPAYKTPCEFYQRVLKLMDTDDKKMAFERKILRSMKRAEYSLKNTHHFGIGIDFYTHFTSPIRRICDLGIHLLLKKQLKAKSLLKKITVSANQHEEVATEAEREVQKLYYRQFAKRLLGESFQATIIDIKRKSILLELVKYPIIVAVPNTETVKTKSKKSKTRLAQRRKVKIVKVDQDVEAKFI